MLITLLRSFLRPYTKALVAVVALQFFGTIAALYLPTLNADIIDNGVAKADTAYILQVGGVMLAITLVQVGCSIGAVWFGARSAMGFGRDMRAAVFHRVGTFSAREVTRFGAPCHHRATQKAGGARYEHSHDGSFSCTSRSVNRALSIISSSPKFSANPSRMER